MKSPTFPVTHTAAFVTHTVTPRMTKSAAAPATSPARSPATSQTRLVPGKSHGFGTLGICACAVGAWAAKENAATSSAHARRSHAASRMLLRQLTFELLELRDGREELA